jgi:hypothetical protein
MWTGWCVKEFNTVWNSVVGQPQRYWQYSFNFFDYNSNKDEDKYNWNLLLWDEDWDWNIIWDNDDENLWIWPETFSWSKVDEIYLISADKRKRTLFRWRTFKDEDKETEKRWTIEFLRLSWKDWWFEHSKSWTGFSDWVIDTWIIDKDFTWWDEIIAGKWWTDNFWQPLFWKNVNVKNPEFYLFPNKDLKLSWKDISDRINISTYMRIKMTLSPSYSARKWFRWKIPEIKINTTINLTDIYSR